jgi:hypothetical protein
VTIEKVFAIEAEPAAIWEALWSDLANGDESAYSVEHSTWPESLTLRVKLSGMPCELTYRIEPRDGHCEVSADITPLSSRYGLYQVLTFGHLKRNYELVLAVGLSNLKAAVEGASPPHEAAETG